VETGEHRERDPKESRQRMQMKDNAPCNNQPKEPKERKTKRRKPSTKKIVSQKVLPKEPGGGSLMLVAIASLSVQF
jgi:hypothetical protein